MIGKTVSHYRILATVGIGGMSVVYKAQDTRLGRLVALKFLMEKFCRDPESLERFQQEARTASALNHPGICTIHDIDRHREQPFIVMEYLEGETLRDKLRARGLTMKEAVGCGFHIADVVSRAHRVGIVHRDISPANLFITLDGRVKLLDFGIAKEMSVDWTSRKVMTSKASHLTLTGTIQYMSPEQALVQEVDTRSDIFSIGVVLYEMLTGQRPFSGPTLTAVIDQIVKVTPPCVGDLVPNIPSAVQRIVSKCLEKRPEQRYQTAERLREDLKLTARTSTLDMERRVKSSAPSMSSAKTIPDTTHAKELV